VVEALVVVDSSYEDHARRLPEDEWWRLGEARTIALRLRARILGLRRLAVLAGFGELNPQIAGDVSQTALAGSPIRHHGYPQGAGAVLGT
jgi:hypothetical protein